jgi:tetratricopeptide (TPR) repeat protein
VASNRDKVLEAAQKFVEKKKYDKAVAEYQKIVQEDPKDARTLLKIGDLQSKMEAYADAIGTYERVGKFYAQQGFALKAIAVYKQIRELIAKHVPQLEEKYTHITPKLAELYQQLGLTSDALAALDEVATRLQHQQRDAEAIDVFRKIVDLDPTNPLPHLRLAEALSRVKDIDGAVAEFGLAATQLTNLGRRDDAIKVLERLLHHKADPFQARAVAELYLSRGAPNDGMQALSKLQLCFQSDPKDLDTLALLARAFGAIGQASKGIEVQKEMARIARDQGKNELFQQLVDKLMRLAPNDEGVQKLANSAAGSIAPPPQRALSQRPDEPSFQEVDDDDIEEDLRRASMPPPADANDYLEADPDMIVEEQEELVEELEEVPMDASEQLAQVLADAASFRRVRLYNKAIETLRLGTEIDPRSIEVREFLRDVYLDAGRHAEAIEEMLVAGALFIEGLDGDNAARVLQDVLSLDPENDRAIEMLRGLGYEFVEEGAPLEGDGDVYANGDTGPTDASMSPSRFPQPMPVNGRPGDALPSYDLEEVGPADISSEYKDARHIQMKGRGGLIDEIDDPFNADAPLPSFPLDGPVDSEESFDLVKPNAAAATDEIAPEQYAMYEEAANVTLAKPGRAPSIAPAPSAPPVSHADLEEALEEADFFASRGLFDDARNILNDQNARFPNHPLLRERMGELAQQEQAARGSGAREMPRAQQSPQAVDRAFDIAASLGASEPPPGTHQAAGFEQAGQQVDVEEVFAKFKEGVAKQISIDDGQSHYDLGMTYKEMTLLDDSIREFETAARDPKLDVMCRFMIGTIEMERGSADAAIAAFNKGLTAKLRAPDQEVTFMFEIGAAYESKKSNKDALDYYQRVQRRDPKFRDVGERVRRLTPESKVVRTAPAAVADDEFDLAFDGIIGSGKS